VKTADEQLIQIALDHHLVRDEDVLDARRRLTGPQSTGSGLVRLLLSEGRLETDAFFRLLAREFDLPRVALVDRAIDPKVLDLVPRSYIDEHRVIPFAAEGGVLQVALSDPCDLEVIDGLAHLTGWRIAPALAPAVEIERAIARSYGQPPLAPEPDSPALGTESPEAGEVEAVRSESTEQESSASANEAPINHLVQAIIAKAIERRASDIHLEPLGKSFRVRYRIDGVLLEGEPPPLRLQLAIISRLKIMANISIAEKRLPQDGRIQVENAGRRLDLRVSSLPTAHGESIVMRVLDPEGLKLGLPELGFLLEEQLEFERLLASPDGMVLVTGPTGSGKTTTLYACLHQLNRASRKIITVEEPVEYQISGINQVPVNPAIGMTFAAALRAMLRQAPNIVMVGEIRDRETAEIAINASLTGHLVFSTLHTNDAPSAVTRLVDMGVKPFLVAAALRASVAQRLVRRNCPHCRRLVQPTGADRAGLGLGDGIPAGAAFMRGDGCGRCHGTGFLGRIGVFENFLVNDDLRSMISTQASANELRKKALRGGMRTMREDGVRKVLAGHTTIAEVMGVTVANEH